MSVLLSFSGDSANEENNKIALKIIYSTLVALGLSLSSLSHSQYLFTPPKAKSAEVLQLYLSQQRIQAGLQSKP